MNKHTIAALIPLTLLISLSGCLQQKKKEKPLKKIAPLTAETADYTQTQDGLTVMVKAYTTKQEAVELLGKRGKKLFKKKKNIYSIQITIKNDTKKDYILDKKYIDLILVEKNSLKSPLIASIGGAITMGVVLNHSGALILPILGLMSLLSLPVSTASFMPLYLGLNALSSAATGIGVYKRMQSKKQTKEELINTIECKAHSRRNVLIFTNASSFKQVFNITLYNSGDATQQHTFSVNLATDQD